jgi:GntR family transcriptional regulator/MocR family aminotransferase
MTVNTAYAQLRAEGFVTGSERSGTFVADLGAAHEFLDSKLEVKLRRRVRPRSMSKGSTATAVPSAERPVVPRTFRVGLPALDEFPYQIWGRLISRRWRKSPRELARYLGYSDAAGLADLRRSIAQYVGTSRGVHCDESQIVVVAGAQQGLYLVARALLTANDAVWMEDPGYFGARIAFREVGARLVGVPVDENGMNVEAAPVDLRPTVIYTSPSHQFPLGITMSATRRMALLRTAHRFGAWVVEDDYDSEFRYSSRPLSSLQGMERGGAGTPSLGVAEQQPRTIYIGTFAKTIFPALRLGYVVAPRPLLDRILELKIAHSRFTPLADQWALADFIAEGHFLRHIRRMRLLYDERRAALVHHIVSGRAAEYLDLTGLDAGLHAVAWLRREITESSIVDAATQNGVELTALGRYCLTVRLRPAILLGYAGFSTRTIRAGVERLELALQTVASRAHKGHRR